MYNQELFICICVRCAASSNVISDSWAISVLIYPSIYASSNQHANTSTFKRLLITADTRFSTVYHLKIFCAFGTSKCFLDFPIIFFGKLRDNHKSNIYAENTLMEAIQRIVIKLKNVI